MADLTLAAGETQTLDAAGARFGSAGRTAGVYYNVGADSFMSSTGADGGVISNGTIEGWFRRSAAPGSTALIFGHLGWYWVGVASNGNLSWTVGNGAATDTGIAVSDGTWRHVAIQVISGQAYLLLNGTVVSVWAATNAPASAQAYVFSIGGSAKMDLTTFGHKYGTGNIDEVALSQTAQYPTANALNATYTVPTAAFPNTRTGQRSLYHFDGDLLDSNVTVTTTAIAATDANIVYSPGNWGTVSANRKTINAGAYCRALLVCDAGVTGFALNFDLTNDLTPVPQVTYRIDGGPWQTAAVAASVAVAIPAANTWGKHLIEFLVKATTETRPRWTTTNTEVVFTGITVTGASAVTAAIRQRALKILSFGTSITEGVRALGSTQTNDTDRNDARLGFAYQLGELLGAEIGVVGFGATGIVKPSGSGAVPAFASTYNLLWGSGPARSFIDVDAIVLEHGHNDAAYDAPTFTAAYVSALNLLLAATSAKTMIFALRPLSGTHAADIQAAVAACTNPKRVVYVDTTGWFTTADSSDAVHPYGYASVAGIAPLAASAIRAGLAVSKTLVLNVGGVAVPAASFGQ